MSEYPTYDGIKFHKNVTLEDILKTPYDSNLCYFIEVDLNYPDNIKERTKHFPFIPENKIVNPDGFSDSMKEIKPYTYKQNKKLLCDCSDYKNYLVQYREIKFYVKNGMGVDKVQEIISYKQSQWLEKYISFNTQKRNQAVNDFEKTSINYSILHFMEKLWKICEIDVK